MSLFRIFDMANVMFKIFPYRQGDGWAFDDERRGLLAEPFVLGIPVLIEKMLELLKIESDELVFTFSENVFPRYHGVLRKQSEDAGGAWYSLETTLCEPIRNSDGTPFAGWLCPATLKFFDNLPQSIYFHINERAR